MKIKELTCINCPVGCALTAEVDEEGNLLSLKGNSCNRGKIYATQEVKDPRRILCSTVHLDGGRSPLVSVKTKEPVPKPMIRDVMREIQKIRAAAPVKIGDVLLHNVAGTGVDIVATKNRDRI
ncbi:DUF1667 domain-containing protein [Peptoniphilaceae bacterium SGI.137]|nr:DUF1667 domain-containing protein [Peptoniphilaceae bacterium]MCI6659844.1 DUF1667 domain-containing protein [Peptoniphilaceae bacterium]MDY3987221.1 DUF1667 domain-containing protein [Peptoniphilaceae bacterium]